MWRGLCVPWLLMWAEDAPIVASLLMKSPENRTEAGQAPEHSVNSSSDSTGLTAAAGKQQEGGQHRTESPVEQTMMIQRALYVLVVVTALVVIYFVVRTIRMRRINRKNRKYGILNTNLENMEMRPLDQEDDDEDDTLFDVHHPRR